MLSFPSKLTDEDIDLVVDFSNAVPAGVTISSASVTATVYSGVDGTPSAIVNGSATISNSLITQTIDDGTEGCVYLLTFSATLSDGQIVRKQGYMAIEPASGV